MFDVASMKAEVDRALDLLEDAMSILSEASLVSMSDDDVLEVLRRVERHRRRLPVVDHRLVHELDARGTAERLGVRSTAVLMRDILRLAAREAAARVRAAERLGSAESLTGAPLPPTYPLVASAQAAGEISAEHARVISSTIEELPAEVRTTHADAVERRLVAEAASFDPDCLARLGRHLVAVLDPDGTLSTDEDHCRRRDASLIAHHDGSGLLQAHLTPAALAQWQAVLSALAAPRPTDADGPDPRTAGQRRHDALADAAGRLLASGTLPASGGAPITVMLRLTLDQLQTRTGIVTTAGGGSMSVAQALHLAGVADIVPVVVGAGGGVLAYGRARRIASPAQRRALAARDGGCSFPGCDHPPDWCEAHHVRSWADGGSTDLDNLALLCNYHHDNHETRGWRMVMKDGAPFAIPPPWIDPEQRPIRNRSHDVPASSPSVKC